MTASELNRKLLYRGYDDMVDYLRNSPLNRYLYKKLLDLLPKYDIEVPILTIFNEVYYTCARVRFDNNPGVDIDKRYLSDAKAKLNNSQPAVLLVFCLVWMLFQLKRSLNFHEECFIQQLLPHIKNSDCHERIKLISGDMLIFKEELPDVFPTMTSPLEELPIHSLDDEKHSEGIKRMLRTLIVDDDIEINLTQDVQAWWEVTNHFSRTTIESFLTLFTAPMDKVRFIDSVRWAYVHVHGARKNRKTNEEYFIDLRNSIVLELEKKKTVAEMTTFYHDFDGDDRTVLLSHLEENEFEDQPEVSIKVVDDKMEQYIAENILLKQQNEKQQIQYEDKIAELESKYKQEIDELKAKLQESEKEVIAEQAETEQKEPSFTLSEIVEFAKNHFDEQSIGKEVSSMLIHLLLDHHELDEANFQLIDSIEKAIKAKNTRNTFIEMPNAGQVYISPEKVDNKYIGSSRKEL